jgi:hypothetical protein
MKPDNVGGFPAPPKVRPFCHPPPRLTPLSPATRSLLPCCIGGHAHRSVDQKSCSVSNPLFSKCQLVSSLILHTHKHARQLTAARHPPPLHTHGPLLFWLMARRRERVTHRTSPPLSIPLRALGLVFSLTHKPFTIPVLFHAHCEQRLPHRRRVTSRSSHGSSRCHTRRRSSKPRPRWLPRR